MTLRDYYAVVHRHAIVVALTIALTLLTALAVTMAMDDRYRTSAVLRLDANAVSSGDGRVESSFVERLANTYARIANSEQVAGRAARSAGLEDPPSVDVDPIPNTELLNVTVEADSAEAAAALANASAANLIRRIRELNQARARNLGARFDARISRLVREIAADQQRYFALQTSGAGGPRSENRALALETRIRSKQEALDGLAAQKLEEQLAADRGDFAIALVDAALPPESTSGPSLALILAVGLAVGIVAGLGIALLFEGLELAPLWTRANGLVARPARDGLDLDVESALVGAVRDARTTASTPPRPANPPAAVRRRRKRRPGEARQTAPAPPEPAAAPVAEPVVEPVVARIARATRRPGEAVDGQEA
jgi:uncharacterized protein involved in exopolysaccharide biosynthesis